MDPTVEIESIDPSEARSEGLEVSVVEKRPLDNGEDGELGVPPQKKAKCDGGLIGNMKKVAEILLVLEAMGKMRAGRSPTAAEKEMMEEARGKLAEVCEGFAPKDVFPRDAFGVVIEDLGLSKSKEQRLGFRPPKMSIAEKVLLTKRKMEKSVEFSLHSATLSSQRLQTNSSAAAESRGTSNMARMFTADKPNQAPISSGGFQPVSPLGHVSASKSTSLPSQLPASEVRSSMVSSGLPSGHLGRDSSSLMVPRVERAHFRLDGRSNGSYTSQVQANSSGDHPQMKTPTWALQPQSALSAKIGSDNRVPAHTSVKVEGNADLRTSHVVPQATSSKPFITQTTSGNMPSMHQNLQGVNFVQVPSLGIGHNEIGKIVQKLLQPQLPEHPTWTPPSRDYMNKALTCQMCKVTINEVENVLVCDACEKGFHLKCLQPSSQKGIPRGEWHCRKCLTVSNGKPLPPKYGRVMRNINSAKVFSTTSAVQSSPDKNVGTLDEKINQQKITANGNSGLQSAPTGTTGSVYNHLASSSIMPNAREMQGNDISLSRGKMDDKTPLGICPNNVMETLGAAGVSPADSSGDRSCEEKLISESKIHPPAKLSETVIHVIDQSQASHNLQKNGQTGLPNSAEIPSKQCHDSHLMVKQVEQGVAQTSPVESSGTSIGSREDVLHSVDWIGGVLQVADEKSYYQSCCINGIVYKLQDYALFLSSNGKLMPSKLRAMWEDSKTRSKWVIANRCYFPGDLPEVVGRPFTLESNEVYLSNHDSTVMAGLIQGPCEVLSPGIFVEESERRTRLGTRANGGLRPLFLCKWFYDESKGLFRDVSC
ncbi:hypothetical protein F0562_010052 [Nyssa sinensis]|uniref:PHD-type domain-containing protein n=1 Tax=Nyssa sinensis TaxID=561372 RepID=A0A5J4ZZZ4_9ASTE|nr:hypothetical protein F0562_010052 [Nyssa sinensis]